jgi:lipoprotein NlpI
MTRREIVAAQALIGVVAICMASGAATGPTISKAGAQEPPSASSGEAANAGENEQPSATQPATTQSAATESATSQPAATESAPNPTPALDDMVNPIQKALQAGQNEQAVKLATALLKEQPDNARVYYLRGLAHSGLRQSKEAIADFDQVLKAHPDAAEVFDRRGSEHFKLGHFKKSIQDFDRYLELRPEQEAGHWRRGISYYYAGEFDKGAKQFAGYQTVDDNDVENAVWRYICMAKSQGIDQARGDMLKIGSDPRIPLMKVYDLFLDKAKPADVLRAAEAGKPSPELLKTRMFYANLYLGLYYESLGQQEPALKHLKQAAGDFGTQGYMGDVARVHVRWLTEMKTPVE